MMRVLTGHRGKTSARQKKRSSPSRPTKSPSGKRTAEASKRARLAGSGSGHPRPLVTVVPGPVKTEMLESPPVADDDSTRTGATPPGAQRCPAGTNPNPSFWSVLRVSGKGSGEGGSGDLGGESRIQGK